MSYKSLSRVCLESSKGTEMWSTKTVIILILRKLAVHFFFAVDVYSHWKSGGCFFFNNINFAGRSPVNRHIKSPFYPRRTFMNYRSFVRKVNKCGRCALMADCTLRLPQFLNWLPAFSSFPARSNVSKLFA